MCFFTDDENSLVHGMVTSEGLFDGTIFTASDEIYIEPANRYSSSSVNCHRLNSGNDYRCGNQSDDLRHHHTIAYRSRDISVLPTQSCASEELFHRTDRNPLRNSNETGRNGYLLAGGTMRPFYQHVNEGTNRAKPGFYPMDARKKDPMASSHNLELLDNQRQNKMIKFFTDFNQDGQPDNISFMIKRVKVHGEEALQDPSYRFTGDYGVEEFLELFSEEDYDAFCLSYMFTYRDFEKGTLGLAWTGDLKNAGGVCEKNGHYRGSMKSLNTGIITLLNYGKHVPPTVSHVTLAHEIGHNFGSPHDPDECSPGGEDGNFIMFARATSGDKRNNNRFSPCSLVSINPVLNAKARSAKGCFAEPQSAICGNGVVEEGEECDCGWEEDCNDPCCHPQRLHHVPHEIPCRLADGAVCSPSQGPCCTSACTLRSGDKCRDDNGCRDASFCDGRGPQCPPSINKPNKTICNEEFVCYMGECTGSICLAYGLESCQCIAGPEDPPTKSCELCCKLPGEDQPCLSSFAWNSAPYDIPDMLSKPGTPCNDYNGYCDVFQRCREVDPSGPLATLRRLLLSDASLANFQRWITDRWYIVALMILFLLCILCVVTRLLSKRRVPLMKILPIGQEIREDVARKDESLSKEHVTSNDGRIQSMNISDIKKRIVEAMKSIVSPRGKRNDEESLRASTCISRILRLLEKDGTRAVDRSEKQSLNEIEEVEGKRRRSRSEKRREKRRKEMEKEELEKKENKRTLLSRVECQEGERNLGRWRRISFILSGRTIPTNLTSIEDKMTTNSYDIERKVCQNSMNYQSESLVVPDTPDTPIDMVEGRIQTSDLTVLLPES
ncbi:hypothetical protein M0804_002796 [Polistes exclamans]|nr:hypothetical protein M0804_002796 [Polistes exclamans]